MEYVTAEFSPCRSLDGDDTVTVQGPNGAVCTIDPKVGDTDARWDMASRIGRPLCGMGPITVAEAIHSELKRQNEGGPGFVTDEPDAEGRVEVDADIDLNALALAALKATSLTVHQPGGRVHPPQPGQARFALYDRSNGQLVAEYKADQVLAADDTVTIPPFKLELS